MRIIRNISIHLNIWSILSILFVILILSPNLSIILQFFSEPNENWEHIKQYMLKKYIINTLILVVFTGLFTTLIGVSLAWIVTAYDFPFKRFLKWGLMLPLAIPPYIGAYTYHGILNYTGLIQSTLRNSFDISVNQRYFDIMNMPGAIFIFTLFLFPYVYTITRAFLEKQSASMIENARILGSNGWRIFFRIVLPISRVAIVGGVSLVILELLNDYGVVKYFGIQTFSTAIFQTWFGLGDLTSAIKLAGTLMLLVLIILLLEKIIRGRRKYSYASSKIRPLQPNHLKGWKASITTIYCFGIFSFAFLFPVIQLILWMFMTYEKVLSKEFYSLIGNSILVASVSALLIVIIALVIGNFTRLNNSIFAKIASKITILGYSIPGAVIAIGVLTLFLDLDKALFGFYARLGMSPTLLLSTSLVMLSFAYVIRFLAIGYNSIEAGFEKVGKNFTEASRTLGMSVTKTFFKVDLKLIRGAVVGGFILAWIEIIKELPLTLLLRPFNFETLATKAFQYASDEKIHEAAIPSLFIISISALLIFFFYKILDKEPS
ncbi:ABC transporter permease [Paraliobacillus quinghaiensis]|uniref:ABC transporter permease n=1 Tax=Paraliobacillus quinghaiensis TaxID=470815 RepID=A0A917WYQ8_9BACI|nr:iron ABC transporter permease [Paraliobacillus quinghaiensis]GGM42465.1 ABC transporter permease [Paraliobacillus quinghaiensis]